MDSFTDRVIIITGASEGIGRALALTLAPDRPKLVLAARNEERLEDAAAQCREFGAEVLGVPTDVTQESACKTLVDTAIAEFGRIDALVNNAGGTMWAKFDEVEDLGIFERLMQVNYLGAVYCTYYALPHLKNAKGLIVALSSVAGLTGVPTRSGYAATKHAMFGFFDSLRIEIADSGVDVTIVAPDFVVSEIHKRALQGNGQPLGESPLDKDKIMSARTCAELIALGMKRRQRLVLTSTRGRFARLGKAIAPGLIDRIAKRAIESGH